MNYLINYNTYNYWGQSFSTHIVNIVYFYFSHCYWGSVICLSERETGAEVPHFFNHKTIMLSKVVSS